MEIKGLYRTKYYHAAKLFLLSLIVVSVYAVNAFGETYTYVSTIGVTGVPGSDNGHFGVNSGFASGPSGVALDGLGNIYVADIKNQRIQIFNSSGAYVGTLGVTGVPGTDNSHFYYPSGVAVDGLGNIYIADTDNQRIQIFNSSGAYVGTLGVTGVPDTDNSHFNNPYGVAVDGLGNIYVADTDNQRIQIFNSSGAYVGTLGVTGVLGTDNGHFAGPDGVAVDGPGNVYVADSENDRIQKFNSSAAYLSTIGVAGVSGSDDYHFYISYAVAVDSSGNVYVADLANQRVQKFSPVPGDNCTATLSSDFSVHVPVATYNGQFFTGDFQWDGGKGVILTNDTLLTDTSAFASCTPATVSSTLDIYIPVIMYNGISYWAKLQYDQGFNFTVNEYGVN